MIDSPKASGSVAHSRGLVAALFSAALAMSACGGGGGGGGSAPPPPPSNGDQPYADPTFYSTAPTGALANAIEGGALTLDPPAMESKLWSHPTLWQYFRYRWQKGVR